MVTRSFKTLTIPTLPSTNPTTGKPTSVSMNDLAKTQFVINQLQGNTAAALKPLLQNPIATNFKTLPDVVLTAGVPNTVNHLLGQTLNGWNFSRPQGFTMLMEDANQPNLQTQIVIWTYIDTVCDIIVW